ncbi:hypothetical protein [Streptomyces sp. NPDC051079]|uniref:hypothetical protein n=1 Tax=unclassified Streptomyces TaxID=2593676 RepID=UPI00344F6D49
MSGVVKLGRRGVLALGAAAALGACTSPAKSAEDGKVRTDPEPLERRFTALGRLSDVHWLGTVLGADSRGSVPGPTDVRVVGFAQLRAGGVRALTGAPKWAFRPATPGRPPEALVPYASKSARWVRSASFDDEVTGGLYAGTFHFDETGDRVYFDTTNPRPTVDTGP